MHWPSTDLDGETGHHIEAAGGAGGVTSQYFTGQREGTDQYCQSLTADVDTHNHCYKEVHLHHHQPPIVP